MQETHKATEGNGGSPHPSNETFEDMLGKLGFKKLGDGAFGIGLDELDAKLGAKPNVGDHARRASETKAGPSVHDSMEHKKPPFLGVSEILAITALAGDVGIKFAEDSTIGEALLFSISHGLEGGMKRAKKHATERLASGDFTEDRQRTVDAITDAVKFAVSQCMVLHGPDPASDKVVAVGIGSALVKLEECQPGLRKAVALGTLVR